MTTKDLKLSVLIFFLYNRIAIHFHQNGFEFHRISFFPDRNVMQILFFFYMNLHSAPMRLTGNVSENALHFK